YCRLRRYGTKDYVQVENFTDRSQNIARVVGKEEVKHIYKCIQCTSEFIYAFMDGLVEIPTLKFQLFGRATPFQDGSETRNIIEDVNTTTLPCRDIKMPDQIVDNQKDNGLLKVGREYVQRVGDNLRKMVDHPTILGQKEKNIFSELGTVKWGQCTTRLYLDKKEKIR
ncbi:hypothetical protein H5410_036150, partial [Solanum commersonii]